MDDDIRSMFGKVAASFAARNAAVAVASVQAEHYRQLKAEGMTDEIALHMTEATSKDIVHFFEVVARQADAIARALEIFQRTQFGPKGGGS